MRSLFGAFALLALAVPLVSSCSTSREKRSGDFEDVSKQMNEVAVMPPGFVLQEVAAFSGQAVSEMTHDIETEIKSAIEAVIGSSDFDVARLDVSDDALAEDPDMRRLIFAQANARRAALEAIANTKGKSIDVAYTGDIDYFADMADCDFILFVDGFGWFKTAGAQVKEAVLAGLAAAIFGGGPSASPTSSTALRAFIVDANRGKVVWFNQVEKLNQDPRRPSQLFNTSKALLKPLVGKVDLKADKSRDDEITDRYKEKMKAIEEEEKVPEQDEENAEEDDDETDDG